MTHPFAHPSWSSNVARDSSVTSKYFTSDFMHFLAQLRRKSLCLDESGGLFCEALCFPIRLSILFRVVLGTSVRPDYSTCKILLIISQGTFRKFLFQITYISLFYWPLLTVLLSPDSNEFRLQYFPMASICPKL